MSIYKGTTLIAGALPNAANQDLSNLSQTGQAVIDGKADRDLTNVTDTGKILMSGMGMPSDKYINLTLGASGSTYTAPANGWFQLNKRGNANQYININSTNGISIKSYCPNYNGPDVKLLIPVLKGHIITVTYDLSGATDVFRFYYAQGSESEAS